MSYVDWAGSKAAAGVGVALVAAAGVGFAGVGLDVFTACQTSLLPFLTHVNETALVFATAPSLAHAPPALVVVFAAENAIGAERIPSATTELTKSREILLEELVMEKPYSLLSASTSNNRYLYCY